MGTVSYSINTEFSCGSLQTMTLGEGGEKEEKVAGGGAEGLSDASVKSGLAAGAVNEGTVGKTSIGSNLKTYASGWGGNQYVSTTKVAEAADLGAKSIGAIGLAADTYSLAKGNISPFHYGLNASFGFGAAFAGPLGIGAGLGYGAASLMYPDAFGPSDEYQPSIPDPTVSSFSP